MNASPTSLFADLVYPVVGPPIRDAVVTMCDGKIQSVNKVNRVDTTAVDLAAELGLPRVAILPGLVNAHTHLEFSELTAPLGTQGMAFADWIRTVIAHRQASNMADCRSPEDARRAAIEQGLHEVASTGTTTLGEIATMVGLDANYQQSQLGGVVFLESLGMSGERVDAALQASADHLNTKVSGTLFASEEMVPDTFFQGFSPHAPYSTHRDIVAGLCELAAKHRTPVAMHLAESPEEIQLLQTHQGAMRQLLEDLGVWQPAGLLRSASEGLQLLATADRSLVIHGNYLTDDDIAFIANQPSMAVVYCPRTHTFFNHSPYPLRKLLDAGVAMALGTDSRASNPDLSMLAEIREVARKHPDVAPEEVLPMATIGGSTALGFGEKRGQLSPGAAADLCVVSLSDKSSKDPHAELFDEGCEVVATACGGQFK